MPAPKVFDIDAAQTFVDVMQKLYAEQFTGETLIRWAQGHPRVVEIPSEPRRIVLQRESVSVQS